jgi:hypothetical protein
MTHYGIVWMAIVLMTATACSTSATSIEGSDYQLTDEEKEAFGSTVVPDSLSKYYVYEVSFLAPLGIEDSRSYIAAAVHWKGGSFVEESESGGIVTMLGRINSGKINSNTAGLVIKIQKKEGGSKINVRAVAKERLINQDTSRKAVERLIADFEKYSGTNVTRL